ncbi:hypothetical protein L210DRAFT_3768475 [Boletus edulis BED1]|uniref:Uncharacterized protein n=1 Tax=Boletus edulis BED1 TaxID=1328754 RepID=A0AAD4BAG8_BOLED|nr:hypothetical protein L210DRAFT_3768475 [Boletus edulis BED1]
MDDTQDNTSIENVDLLESSRPPSQQPSQSTGREQTLEEILAQSSTDLIHSFASSINQSAIREASRSEEFKQEFKRRLLRAIIRTYVWSTARLAHETEAAEARLGNGVQALLSAEREQGRSSPPPPTMLGSSVSVSVIDFVHDSRS